MDKSAVLHWLHDIKAATADAAENDSNGGSLSPNTSGHRSSFPRIEHHHNHPYHHQPPHQHEHLQSPLSSIPLPDSRHLFPKLSSTPLVPSSSFQVPEHPGKDGPPEVVRKFFRSNTISSGHVHHGTNNQVNKPESDLTRSNLRGMQDTGIKLKEFRGKSLEASAFPSKGRQAFPPTRLTHQKNRSWSFVPASNPEFVQPTIDLSKEGPKRKMLVKTKLSQLSVSTSFSFDAGPITSPNGTTLTESAVKSPPKSLRVSPPKSAPVSPNLSVLRKAHSSISSEVKCLSHSNLADFDNSISDVSSSRSCSVGKGSVDVRSHVADKGGFSDITSSDGGHKMLCDSGTSSSLDQDMPVRVCSEQEKEEAEALDEPNDAGIYTVGYGCGRKSGDQDLRVDVAETSHRTSPKVSSPMESSTREKKTDLESNREDSAGSETGEELLKILKKWFKQGYGEKEDLVRAMRLTGHRNSACELMKDEDLKEECKQEQDNGNSLNPTRSNPETNKVQALPLQDAISPSPLAVTRSPDRRSVHSDSHSPRTQSPVSLPSASHPPLQTMPPTTSASKSSPHCSLSPLPLASQPPISPVPITLLPLSRKKLAELDKVNCFSFDDSSDDILDARSSSSLAKNRSSPLSSKTHSWSLSDYSGSITSSSSYSNHAVSPGQKMGSPTFSKQSSAETSEHQKWTSNMSPLHHGYSIFAVPEESRETSHVNSQRNRLFCQDDKQPVPVVFTSTSRLNLFSVAKSSSLAQDGYSSPRAENLSNTVHERN